MPQPVRKWRLTYLTDITIMHTVSRPRHVPDNYVGDRHLANWFKRNLGMVSLHMVYVDPEQFIRDELTRSSLRILGGTVLLHFINGQVTTVRINELEITK